MKLGIVGYGSYIPCYRITAQEIAQENNHDWKKITASLGVTQKSVPANDEDAVTLGVRAARNALTRAGILAKDLGVIYVGSESHPYAVKPSASIIGAALGIGLSYAAADLEFACKAGTAGLQAAYAQVKSGFTQHALAIGTDTAQAAAGDILEYTAGAGAAAYIIGSGDGVLVTIDATMSLSTDTPDFWRRGLRKFPEHVGRFTAEPGYFSHIQAMTQAVLERAKFEPKDFAHVVFHQPNARFPTSAGARLGFTPQQLEVGLLVKSVGNCYSASTMLGLTAVLDVAKPGQRLLLISYGSGSGCDAFVLTATERLPLVQAHTTATLAYAARRKQVSYSKYRYNLDMIY
jgi:hydroxymethylglutaryl-CoA synthase